MTEVTISLLPCPFCDSDNIVETSIWSGFHREWLDCNECKCCGASATRDIWNTRATLSHTNKDR